MQGKKTVLWNFALLWLFSLDLHAQEGTSRTQQVGLDSTEGWAMAHAMSSTLNLGHGPPKVLPVMGYRFSAEIGSIPHIRREDTRVGFGGFKLEDLNKSPVFGRGTVHVGMPGSFTLAVSWTPPVSVNGAKPKNLFGVALEKRLVASNGWELAARVYAQTGDAQGDITCSRRVATHPPGSADNPFGCREKSRDTLRLDHHGGELLVSRMLADRWQPYAAVAVTQARPKTNVSARVFDILDEPELRTRGTLTTTTLGTGYRLSEQWGLTGAVSYTPLYVRRPPERNRRSHDFWSVRLGVSWHGL
jgi:hypothetical protein